MANIDYNLYKVFIKAYECRNITKAANELYITQPTMSHSIKMLENQLNVQLFYRNSKGIEPTEYAKMLYPCIKEGFKLINNGEYKIKDFSNLETGIIRIGIQTNVGAATLTKYIKSFHKKYPGIKIELVSKLLEDMIVMLENRELDFIVDFLPVNSEKFNIDINYITTLTTCFATVKNNFPKINYENFELKDIDKYPLIIPRKNCEMRNELDIFFKKNNIVVDPIIEVSTQLLTQKLVESGLGIGYFIKESILDFIDNNEFKIININAEMPKMKVNIAYISNFLSYASQEFLNYITKNNKYDSN